MSNVSLMISLILPFILCNPSTYFGIRVAKTCDSIIRDNLVLTDRIIKQLKEMKMPDIIVHEGDWWNYATLTLTDIKGNLEINATGINNTLCTVTPTGTFELTLYSDAFDTLIEFKWQYNFALFKFGGDGRVRINSRKIVIRQSYAYGKTTTSIIVQWQIVASEYRGIPVEFIRDWLKNVVNEKVIHSVSFAINSNLSIIDNGLLKPYDKMIVKAEKRKITIANAINSSQGESFNHKRYAVINFGATISSPGKEYKKIANAGIATSFDNTNKTFDYEVCYNPKLFGEYLNFLVRTDETTFNKTNDDIEYVAFYRTIFQYLSNIYPDDKEVTIHFKADPSKDFTYLDENKMELETITTFSVDSNSPFLTLYTNFEVKYNISLDENNYLTATLIEPEMLSVESHPPTTGHDRLIIFDIASRLTRYLEGFKIIGPNGLYVNNIRIKDYKLSEIEWREKEICYLYIDKGK